MSLESIIDIVKSDWPMLLKGAGMTLLIALVGTVIGSLLGLLIGIVRTIPVPDKGFKKGLDLAGGSYIVFEPDTTEDVTEEDIESFIIECIEQIKNSYDQTDDEFMRIMFNTFIERVDVSNEKITIHIRMDFSIMSETVANRQLSGVFHSLPTVTMERVIKRKKHVHGRNF